METTPKSAGVRERLSSPSKFPPPLVRHASAINIRRSQERKRMANMMAGIVLSLIADSGYGIRIGGFHGPTAQFNERMKELQDNIGPIQDIVSMEDNGYLTFIALSRESAFIPSHKLVATLRQEPHKFFQALPRFLASTKAQYVDRMVLTGSLGSISLSLLYRPVERDSG